MSDGRLDDTLRAIDDANAEDPNELTVDGETGPKELVHGQMMTSWVRRLDPEATDLQPIAARAHHFRRWTTPRSEHPEGRSGYLRWRTAARTQHAGAVSSLLTEKGFDAAEIDRVSEIIRKEHRATDPAVQTHEDALCLVFLQTQLGDITVQLGEEQTADVLVKSIRKMSPRGVEAALGLDLAEPGRSVFDRVVGRSDADAG